MKTGQPAIVGVVLGLLMTANAMAQNAPQMTIPWSVRQTAYGDDYYVGSQNGAAAPADNAAPPAPNANGATAPKKAEEAKAEDKKDGDKKDEEKKDEDKPTCRWCMCGKLADPWTLPQPDCLKEKNITIGGWMDTGIYGNQYGAPSNGPVGLRSIGDGWTLDQMWVYAERKTDTKGCGWDFGGRVDYVFGTDGPQTQCFGDHSFDWDWNTSSQYGFAMPQIYGEIAHDDVKVKIGHFYTPIGYEVVQATGNFFYSHSYSHTFGEPFTHTGALAAWAPNEKVTWYSGWVDGWDEGFADNGKGSMFLGGFSLNLSDKTTVAWYVSAGRFGNGMEAFSGVDKVSGDLYYNCFIFTHKITDKLTYVFENDLGVNFDTDDRVTPIGDNQWYAIANYLNYKMNDCWSLGGRFEWFQDPEGARVSPGCRGNYWEMTAGINYKPHANVTIRPEIRYDWFDSFAGNLLQPFNNGTSSSQLSGGVDFVFTF
jgi:hypothetical protein